MKPKFEQTFSDFDLQIASLCSGRRTVLPANRLRILYRERYSRLAETRNFEIESPFGTYQFAIYKRHGAAIIKLRRGRKVMSVGGIAFYDFHSESVWQVVIEAYGQILRLDAYASKNVLPLKPTGLPWPAIAALPTQPINSINRKAIDFETLLWPFAIAIVGSQICEAHRN